MRARKTLPEGYYAAGKLDLRENRLLLVMLNILSLAALFVIGGLFYTALNFLRPGELRNLFGFSGSIASTIRVIVSILALTVLYVSLHEAIHGLFFWIYTRSRPKFAVHWSYAYAAAPDWYLYRNPFLVTTLAPLLLISLVGLAVLSVAPSGWLLPGWFVLTMNASGAVGDLAVTVWLASKPASSLIQDRGDAITLYRPPASPI